MEPGSVSAGRRGHGTGAALGRGESWPQQDWTRGVLRACLTKQLRRKLSGLKPGDAWLTVLDEGAGQGEEWGSLWAEGLCPFCVQPSLYVSGSPAVLGIGSLEMAATTSPHAALPRLVHLGPEIFAGLSDLRDTQTRVLHQGLLRLFTGYSKKLPIRKFLRAQGPEHL